MTIRSLTLATAMAVAIVANPVAAETFRFAYQGDIQGLDPHGSNANFTLGYLGNVYEGLTKYDGDMNLVPGLATSWENTSPTTWTINLREDVTFHNGETFNADDVIFSWNRANADTSLLRGRAGLISDMEKVDDYTIKITTNGPQPVLMRELAFLYIMDEGWAKANDAAVVADVSDTTNVNYANRHANGTGPYRLESRVTDVKSVFLRNEAYWGENDSGIERIEFTPIREAATRVAALISGQVDMIFPVPVQDWPRLKRIPEVDVLSGAEARTIFLGMDQWRDELVDSSVTGANPLKDRRVRAAMAHALDLDLINARIMRGAATPTGLMIAPQINGYNAALDKPYQYDPEESRRLLSEAGYPDGFRMVMDCPNDRYVNDEKICQAVVNMLARVGIEIDLIAQTRAQFFGKIGSRSGHNTSFYLMGWTPPSMDAHNALVNLLVCRNREARMGVSNAGNYCNSDVDALAAKIGEETDVEARQALINEAFEIIRSDVGYIPLHQQPLSWGVRSNFSVTQRADDIFDFTTIRMNN